VNSNIYKLMFTLGCVCISRCEIIFNQKIYNLDYKELIIDSMVF
jgi:hypothetical protein